MSFIVTSLTNADTESVSQQLQYTIAAERLARVAVQGTTTSALTSETTSRQAADQVLQTAITAETTRSLAAESAIAASIATETTRATAAETLVTNNLISEIDRAIVREEGLGSDILFESMRTTTLEGNLASEVTRATAAEAALTSSITTNVTTTNTQVTNLSTTVTDYITTSQSQLQTNAINTYGGASTLTIAGSNTVNTLNMATGSGVQTVNIGTGSGVTTINIGAAGDTVAIAGTLTNITTTNTNVTDSNITLNKGGTAGSAGGSGLNFEENGAVTGYIVASSDRNTIDMKAPNSSTIIQLNQPLLTTSNPTFGTVTANLAGNAATSSSTTGNAATVTNGVYTTDIATVTNTMLAGSIASSKLANSAVANLSGINTGDQTNITGNAATVTNGVYTTDIATVTNTMLAGLIASSKLANSAVANLSGINTGDQTNITGNAATVTTIPALSGEVSNIGNAVTLTNTSVINKTLTGFSSSAGTVTSADTILTALQKVNANQITGNPSAYYYYTADSNGVSQTIPNGVGTYINFGTVRSNSFGSNLTATSNLFTNASGKTLWLTISTCVRTDSTASCLFNMWIDTVGGLYDNTMYGQVAMTKGATIQASTICSTIEVPASSSFRVGFYQTSGANLVIGGPFTPLSSVITISNAGGIKGDTGATGATPVLTGEVTTVGSVATLTNSAVIGKTLTAYVKGAGVASSADTILSAIQKVDGNTLVPKGTWSSATNYAINALVSYNGGLYSASAANTNITPGVLANQSVFNMASYPLGSVTDVNPSDLCLTFKPLVSGFVNGCTFYKYASNNVVHTGRLWSSAGTLLASAVFASETASGIQQQLFGTAVAVTAGTTYVISINAQNQYVSGTYIAYPFNNASGNLQALNSGWNYGTAGGTFPGTAGGGYINTTFSPDILFTTTVSWTTVASPITSVATCTTIPALTGEATTTGATNVVTLTNAAVTGKLLTGYTGAAGTIAATDTILTAINKLNGNIAAAGTGIAIATASTVMGRDVNADTAIRDLTVRRLKNPAGVVTFDTATGLNNTFLNQSGNLTATGQANIVAGFSAGASLTNGNYNVFLGQWTGGSDTGGSSNIAIGTNSLTSNSVGGNHIAVGQNTLVSSTGGGSIAIGTNAGGTITTGTNCVFVGISADATVGNGAITNAIAIGANAKVGTSNTIQLGDPNVATVNTSGSIVSAGSITCQRIIAAPSYAFRSFNWGTSLYQNVIIAPIPSYLQTISYSSSSSINDMTLGANNVVITVAGTYRVSYRLKFLITNDGVGGVGQSDKLQSSVELNNVEIPMLHGRFSDTILNGLSAKLSATGILALVVGDQISFPLVTLNSGSPQVNAGFADGYFEIRRIV
jgi:hypothetical protein